MRDVAIIKIRDSSASSVSSVTHVPSANKLISSSRLSGSANYAGQDYKVQGAEKEIGYF